MIEPLNVASEEFPKSEKCSEGMKILEKKYDNYEIWYHRDVVYVERPEAKLTLQLTDISKMNDEPSSQNHIEPDSPEGFLIGRKNVLENPDLVKPTIVMNYISEERKIPPVLIFHGTNDELVPFGQSCMLYDKLKECGKEAYFYALNGSNHGGREFWSDEIFEIIRSFIDGI